MLTKEQLEKLMVAESKDIWEIDFKKCKAGDIFFAENGEGDIYLFELTVPISRRANVYKIKGGNISFCKSYENQYIIYPVVAFGSTAFGEENTSQLVELKKIKAY